MAVKWTRVDELCREFSAAAGEATSFWVETVEGEVCAGAADAPAAAAPITSELGPGHTVCVAGPEAAHSASAFAIACRRELDYQATLVDMVAATARLWRQTNALLRMAASTRLAIEPGHIAEQILDRLARSANFARGMAIVRLAGSTRFTKFAGGQSEPTDSKLLVPLSEIDSGVRTTVDCDDQDELRLACAELTRTDGPVAIAPLMFEGEWIGCLLVPVCDGEPPTSYDLKLLGAAAQILGVAVGNSYTLNEDRAATRERATRDLYEALAKTAPVGIFRTDPEGAYDYVNEQWTTLTGVAQEQALGHGWKEALHDADCEEVLASWRECLARERSFRVEYRVQRSDGEVSWVLANAVVERGRDREIRGYVGTLTDMTASKRAEEEKVRLEAQLAQAQKMEAVGVLAGGVAHDFNNILGTIIGNTELLLFRVVEDERLHKFLYRIQKGAHRARGLVQQMLTFSRPSESSKREAVRPQSLLRDALELVRSSVPTTIDLKTSIDDDCPNIMADPTQIHQIILNLCTNASHAIGDEMGRIHVGLEAVQVDAGRGRPEPSLAEGRYICMSVSDTGRGMSEDVQQRIFEPFFTTKAVDEGTGLGLSVVRGIVVAHEGAIQVESRLGQGTTFRVYLPVRDRVESVAEEQPKPLEFGTARILLVDDEEPLLETARDILERMGYVVTATTSSLVAVDLLRGEPDAFDLVLTDQVMPGLSGTDLLREVTAVRPELPVVVASGYSDVLSSDVAHEKGFRAYVRKPYTIRELVHTVAATLRFSTGADPDTASQ